MKRVLNDNRLFWLFLGLPALPMMWALAAAGAPAEELVHVSGEFAARFLIAAMALAPLHMLFRGAFWTCWLMRRRRAIGVAAFAYAAFHTLLYVIDMGALRDMLAEFWAIGIWTGWAAFALFLPLAVTSNDAAVRRLRRAWKSLHRLIYAAALLTLVHWIFVHNNPAAALAHFAPLALLEAYRLAVIAQRRSRAPAPTTT